MSKNCILNLNAFLQENGYTENSIAKTNEILTAIMTKGHYAAKGVIIGATGVNPIFKPNEKSVRIRLNTQDVRDELIINHPSNSWGSPDDIIIGCHRLFKASITQRQNNQTIGKLDAYTVIV